MVATTFNNRKRIVSITKGPLRTIQAGSGYRSQNSAVQILGYRDEPAAIEILWFDGRSSRVEYVKDQLECIVSYP